MIYFDANVFIYSLMYEDSINGVKNADDYLTRLIEGEISGCTCTLAWDEVFYIVKRGKGLSEAIKAGRHLLYFPNLEFIDVNFKIIYKAQKIIEKFNISPRDAIHAACALIYCNGEIISNDFDFDDIEGIVRKF